MEIAVNMPSHVKADPAFPESHGNLFEFIFSNPFEKGSAVTNAGPAHGKGHHRSKVPLNLPIFVDGRTGSSITWKKLRQDSLTVAGSLTAGPLALKPLPVSASKATANRGAIVSPVVLLHLPNSIQWTVLAYGVLASGLTLTGINPALTAVEVAHIFTKSSPSVVVTTKAGLATIQAAYELLEPSQRADLAYPTRGNVFIVDIDGDDYGATSTSLNSPAEWSVSGWKVQDWKVLLPSAPIPFTPPKYDAPNEDDLRAAVIFWSSGTSGKSKGVVLTHKALASAVISVWYGAGLKDDERLIGLPPFYHIFGWANVLMVGPAFGATVTIVSKFEPHHYLRLAEETRATHLHIAPPVAVLFAKSPLVSGYDLSSVRGCTSGGAPLGVSVIKDVYKRLGFMVKLGYGLSETGGVSGQKCETWGELEKILGSTGTIFDGTEVKIISVDDGKIVTVGEQGEVCIRSKFLFRTYLNNQEATDEAFDSEGFFHTGDVGRFDAQGNLSIVDRLKEVIKVKGFQVAPAELEDGLCGSPLVQDAGVSSIYHEEHATEYPRAYVVPFDKEVLKGGKKADEFAHALRKHVEGKYTPYKWIRGGFVIVEAVPKSPAGKILRRLLKDTNGHLVQVYEEKVRAKL
ncbi:4-coumarate-CoA igase [Meredithblackwellia eburnea MCA 4105]